MNIQSLGTFWALNHNIDIFHEFDKISVISSLHVRYKISEQIKTELL